MTTFLKTTDAYKQGARTLPGRYYTTPEILSEEAERIFRKRWICVGRVETIAQPGDYVVVEIAGESIIVLKDQSGERRAFYNVCRHRGTRLCEATHGKLSETIQCPYHAWTYALDGRLIGAPHMNEVAGFDKKEYPLHGVALAEWEGFLFVNLARDAEPLAEAFAPLVGRFAQYNLSRLRTTRRIEYDVRANWKLILQNYNECLHCPTIHPELSTKLPYTSGANDLIDGPFLGGYMEIKAPNESATMTGRACGLPLGDFSDADRHRAFYYALFPTMMLSLHPDYAVFYTVWPKAPMESRVVCEWMVHPDSPAAPGYNIADAEEFWDRTNRQDWHICEQSQLGVSSRIYQPGPYSPRESIPAAWDREYLRVMGHAAGR
ncbi:MAG TPA: aromatic ring-hydroxylating dioxygenase subunit alpha [Gemmatimonadales bacterium]|nr:aromatic ring-hydroxylating dioxygenase subunit alpha [Gemmatimonadales bacterium]